MPCTDSPKSEFSRWQSVVMLTLLDGIATSYFSKCMCFPENVNGGGRRACMLPADR